MAVHPKAIAFALAVALAGLAAPVQQIPKGTMKLTSTAFVEGQLIPQKYACDGKDISPPLKWSGAPIGAKSFALIADDPDAPAGTWVHWVVYDLPATASELPEDIAKTQFIVGNAKQGLNDFKRLGYGGPCPPPGKAHRYVFKIYALDTLLEIKPGSTKKEIEAAMGNHILDHAQLIGTYQRK
jgi:Raf kinase inhibitor-like YbhB/YbcL family protein